MGALEGEVGDNGVERILKEERLLYITQKTSGRFFKGFETSLSSHG
jgi:hypothetical protein